MKKKQEERFQNNCSYQNVLTQIIGPKGWFWYEAWLSGMYSHCLHTFRYFPLANIQVPITLLFHEKKKSFGTQAITTLRTKATCPDLQRAGSSKHRKGVNHLFFGDLDISSQQTWLWMLPWLLLWNHYSWMNLGVIYFQSVSFQYNLWVYKFSVLPNFQWLKRRQGTASLIQTFAGLLSIRSNQSVTSKYKNTVWRTYMGAVPWIWKT